MSQTPRPLSELRAGTRGRVVALAGGRHFQLRLVNMGMGVGSEIEVLHGGSGVGPTLVAVGETRLALGHGMADKVLVCAEPDGPTAREGHARTPEQSGVERRRPPPG
jgi:ferrous iron transport protein A